MRWLGIHCVAPGADKKVTPGNTVLPSSPRARVEGGWETTVTRCYPRSPEPAADPANPQSGRGFTRRDQTAAIAAPARSRAERLTEHTFAPRASGGVPVESELVIGAGACPELHTSNGHDPAAVVGLGERSQRGPRGVLVGNVVVAEGSRWEVVALDLERREAVCRLLGGSRALRRFRARRIVKIERAEAAG